MNNIHLWRTDYAANNGFRQFYREWRPADASHLPVFALHGSLTQSGMWILPAETAASIPMLCPDQRGFGRSEDPGGDSCAEFAADAVALARTSLPSRYVIMGHSFACSIALEVARLASGEVAAAILVDPVMPAAMRPNAAPTSPAPGSFASRAEAERYFRDTEEGQWTDETLARFVQDIMIEDGQRWRFPYSAQRLQRLRAFTASGSSDYDLFGKAKATRCPVLVFRGGMSKRFPAATEQTFLAAFAKAKLVVCPDSGHFPTATEAKLVAAELRLFLDSITPK